MRDTVGEIDCLYHETPVLAEVRRDKNGKMYVFCPNGCGPHNIHGRTYQEWLLNNARLYGAKEKSNARNTGRESTLRRQNASG